MISKRTHIFLSLLPNFVLVALVDMTKHLDNIINVFRLVNLIGMKIYKVINVFVVQTSCPLDQILNYKFLIF